MYFFKFQKPRNLEFNMLRRGEVFFATVAELNDANECRPWFVLNGTKELWTRLATYILQEACLRSEVYDRIGREEFRELLSLGKSLGSQLKQRVRHRDVGLEKLDLLFRELLEKELANSTVPTHPRLILESTRDVIRHYIPKVVEEHSYIASFSRNAKNPTMWGHYADAERGFVVIYTTDNGSIRIESPIKMLHGTRPLPDHEFADFEIGIYKQDDLKLKVVQYGRKPPKVNAFHRLIPKFSYSEEEDHYDVPLMLEGDAKAKEESQIGLVKFSDWRYEQEIRAFLPVYNEIPPDMRIMRVGAANICGLIFGPRMSQCDKIRAVLCCHLMRESTLKSNDVRLPQFNFFQARQVVDRFDFRIVPVGILDGLYFEGHLPIKSIDDLDESSAQSLREMSERIGNPMRDASKESRKSTSAEG